jgi:hypothetical protein
MAQSAQLERLTIFHANQSKMVIVSRFQLQHNILQHPLTQTITFRIIEAGFVVKIKFLRRAWVFSLTVGNQQRPWIGRSFFGDAAVKSPDGFHIGENIFCWIDQRPGSANLAPIVEKTRGNRKLCAASDVVKPRFPPDDAFVCSGRCDDQNQLFIPVKFAG